MTSWINQIYTIVFLLLFSGVFFFATTEYSPTPNRYIGELTNTLNESIGLVNIGVYADTGEYVRFDIECYCQAKCKKEIKVLQPDETLILNWDGIDNDCEPVPVASYHAEVKNGYDGPVLREQLRMVN